jgi:ubiquinone/menaquinone biosynthesis C-methylase UbiE
MMLLYITVLSVVIYKAIKFGLRHYHPIILNFMMKKIHVHISEMKTALFAEAFAIAKDQATAVAGPDVKLKVLEIGVGTGENFKHYPRNALITTLDKTDKFKSYYEDSIRAHQRPDLVISDLVVSQAEDMRAIETNSMDIVLHTFVLCSVNDRHKVLTEVYRVLKPGGVCVFVEHSADVADRRRMLVQKCIEPWLGDCHFVNIRETMEAEGVFDEVHVRDFFLRSVTLYFLNPIVYGYGKKKRLAAQ